MSAIKILSGLDISGTTSNVRLNGKLGVCKNATEALDVNGNACATYVYTPNLFMKNDSKDQCAFLTSELTSTPTLFVQSGITNTRIPLTIDASAVGIGRSDPQVLLHLDGGDELLRLQSGPLESPFISFYQDDDTIRRGFIQWNTSENSLKFANEYGDIRFDTGDNGTELNRMIITSGGTALIGKTASDFASDGIELRNTGNMFATISNGVPLTINRKSSTGRLIQLYQDSIIEGSIDVNSTFINFESRLDLALRVDSGDNALFANRNSCVLLYYNNSQKLKTITNGVCIFGCGIGTDFIATSDCRLKENFTPIEDPIELTMGLCGQKFNWRTGNKETEYGLVAQEVEKISPELVSCQKIDLDGDRDIKEIEEYRNLGINDYVMGIKYEKVIPILIEAIKKQQLEIKEIKEKLQLLENKTN